MNVFSKAILFLFFLLITGRASAQEDTTFHGHYFELSEHRFGIVTGYNFWTYHFVEIGVGYNRFKILGSGHPNAWSIIASSEILIRKEPVVGFKLGSWISGGFGAMALGGNFIYYTDFNGGSLQFRPEIVVGIGPIKCVYGYNLPLTNREFGRTNRHVVSFVYIVPLKKSIGLGIGSD